MIVTVNTAALMSEAMIARYANAHGGNRFGMRLILDTLGIALPAPLARKSPGRKRSADPSRVTLWRDSRKALA